MILRIGSTSDRNWTVPTAAATIRSHGIDIIAKNNHIHGSKGVNVVNVSGEITVT
jgi:hypothetical protein